MTKRNRKEPTYEISTPLDYLEWSSLASSYLGTAYRLAKEIKDQEDRGTYKHGLVIPIYLFRHGLELALKSYSLLFKIPIVRDHDVELIGSKISQLLPTLNTEDMESADDPVEVNLPDDLEIPPGLNLKHRKLLLPQWRVMHLALKTWEVKLPEIVLKYNSHAYVAGVSRKDKKNFLLRYPDDHKLRDQVEGMTEEELEQVIEDIYDQGMLLQLVFAIQMGQPLKLVE